MAEIIQAHEFLTTFKAFNSSLCKEIISNFESAQNRDKGKTLSLDGKHQIEENVKNCDEAEILIQGHWASVFNQVHPIIQECIQQYISFSPALQSVKLSTTGYKIKKYTKDEGFFKWHADSIGKGAINRVFAVIVYLNNVNEGGETEFHHQKIKVKPIEGTLIIFPTAWTHLHCGNMPTSNNKYILTCFVQVKDS